MPVYTPVYASLLALLFIRLCVGITRIRHRERIAFYDGGRDDLTRAIRAQGNFIEYVPLSLILLGFFEAGGGGIWLVNLLGVSVLAGRILHAYGVLYEEPKQQTYTNRTRGMVLTFTAIVIMALGNLCLAVFR